jgi:hypothetical protein
MAQDPSKPQGAAKPAAASAATPNAPAGSIDVEQLGKLLAALATTGGVPIALSQAPPTVVTRLVEALASRPPVTVAFPPCADVMLALIHTGPSFGQADDVTKLFAEYFKFAQHQILVQPQGRALADVLDPGLLGCLGGGIITGAAAGPSGWPPPWCLPPSCVTLGGNRRLTGPRPPARPELELKRLFLGDVLFLYFFGERLGIFKILGAILDDYATRGAFPISNGALDTTTLRDDLAALVLEAMCRQTKSGLSSTVRDRDATYRRCLGWTSEAGRPLNLPSQINKGTSQLFHRFIQAASSFNTAKRLATAIRGTTTPAAAASLATLTEIADTLKLLKQRFEVLDYGRNYYNTLSGLVWTFAGLSVIRELRTTLGIPPAYEQPHEYVPAAYDILVLKRPAQQSEINRYEVHKSCAVFGRNLLLDIEEVNTTDTSPDGELERWLAQVEGEIEAYRKAYRDLTGVDLGAEGTPVIEQEA